MLRAQGLGALRKGHCSLLKQTLPKQKRRKGCGVDQGLCQRGRQELFFPGMQLELSRSGPAQAATTISLPWLAQLSAAVASFLRSPCLLLAPQVCIQMLHDLHGRGDNMEGTKTIVCGILPVAMLATTSVLSPWCEKVVRLPHEYHI